MFLQISSLSLQSILVVIYIMWVRPFESRFLNNLEIFNEICILIVSNHLYLFTQYMPNPELQYTCGWSITLITISNVFVNMIVIIAQGIFSAYSKIK